MELAKKGEEEMSTHVKTMIAFQWHSGWYFDGTEWRWMKKVVEVRKLYLQPHQVKDMLSWFRLSDCWGAMILA